MEEGGGGGREGGRGGREWGGGVAYLDIWIVLSKMGGTSRGKEGGKGEKGAEKKCDDEENL